MRSSIPLDRETNGSTTMNQPTTYQPEPRFAETVGFTLDDILTTEAEAARDAENMEAVRELLKGAN
jgi:hypothetical protein